MHGSPTSTCGANGSRSSGSICGTPRASRRSAGISPRRATGSTSSSTTRARPCADRPSSTGTCSRGRRRRPSGMPAHVRRLLGRLRGPAPLRHAAGGRPRARRRQRCPDRRGCALGRALAGAAAARGSRRTGQHLFPEGRLDQDLQQVDLRGRNSWRLLLDEVSSVELLETQLVNAVAPFVLNARLKPLLLRTPERDKHIVNVSAVEGQFYRRFKTTRHPHTNMAKAALNMMTRTSAADYQVAGIHMNSVDTGWVTDEDPVHIAEQKTRRAPLPAAARHRRRRRAHRRSDHRRLQHRQPRLGRVPEGLPLDRLVSARAPPSASAHPPRAAPDPSPSGSARPRRGGSGRRARAWGRGCPCGRRRRAPARARRRSRGEARPPADGRASGRGRSARRRPCRGCSTARIASRFSTRLGRLDLHRDQRLLEGLLHAARRDRGRTGTRGPGRRRECPSAGTRRRRRRPRPARPCAREGRSRPPRPRRARTGSRSALSSLRRTSAGSPPRSAPAMIVLDVGRARAAKCSASATSTSNPHGREHLARRELRVSRRSSRSATSPRPQPIGDPPAHARAPPLSWCVDRARTRRRARRRTSRRSGSRRPSRTMRSESGSSWPGTITKRAEAERTHSYGRQRRRRSSRCSRRHRTRRAPRASPRARRDARRHRSRGREAAR